MPENGKVLASPRKVENTAITDDSTNISTTTTLSEAVTGAASDEGGEYHLNLFPNAVTDKKFRFALCYFYFALGVIVSFPILPVKKIMMDELNFQPAGMALLMGCISVPWAVKPVWGFMSDSYPIRGLRRRPYIAVGVCTNMLSWMLMATIGADTSMGIGICMMFASLGLVIADVAADSLVVENVKLESENDVGKLQSSIWTSRALGSMLAAALSGLSLDHWNIGARSLLVVTGIVSLTGLLSSSLTSERTVTSFGVANSKNASLCSRTRELFEFWRRPIIWQPSLFVLLFASTPSAGDAYFYFMRTKLGFSMELLGWLNVVRYGGAMFAAMFYQIKLRHVPFRRLLGLCIIVASLLGLSLLVVILRWNLALGIPDEVFVFGDTIALAVFAELAFMPIVIVAARVAPHGVEGTVYASIISVINLSGMISEISGGWLTHLLHVTSDNFDNLWLLMLVCGLTTLLPLPFVHLVPNLGEIRIEASEACAEPLMPKPESKDGNCIELPLMA